jgi:hypothetical protein
MMNACLYIKQKTKWWLMALSFALGLSASAAANPPVNSKPEPPAFSAARATMSKLLENPYSAHFGEMRFAILKNMGADGHQTYRAVCGEVNAKNSAGGYEGMSGYVFLPTMPAGTISVYFQNYSITTSLLSGLGEYIYRDDCVAK